MRPIINLTGTVIRGKMRGKSLGFPTANFKLDISTPPGIYVSYTKVKGIDHPSITFIGTVDTFNEKDFNGESYILEFNQDIYGEEIEVSLLRKLRDNQKFVSKEKLIEQMKKDVRQARKYFEKNSH